MRIAAAAALCCLIVLTGCNRSEKRESAGAPATAPAPPIGFQHEPGFDAQGYYRPSQAITVGNLRLSRIAVGAPSDFAAWEGGEREAVFGPVVFEFEDQTSPLEDKENGERHTVRAEVKPLAYLVGPGRFAFHGKDDKLGEIDFEGAFDTPALAQARANGASEDKPVLTGQLSVGAQKFTGVKLEYWAGD
jgi:hypothetical protein